MNRLYLWTVLAISIAFTPAQAKDQADAVESAASPLPNGIIHGAAVEEGTPWVQIPAPPTGKGQVIFFRQSYFGGMPYTFTIKDGEKPVTKLRNGRYFIYVTDPGEHEFRVRGEVKDTLFMEIDEGETYYVEQTMVMGLFYYANLAPSGPSAFNLKPLKLENAAK